MDGAHPSSVSDRIRREAKVVGLRGFSSPSLEAVERRRMQLWILTAVLLVSVSGATALLSMWGGEPLRFWFTPRVLRWGVVLLSLAFCSYAIEKELHLRKLARLLIDERVLTAALSNRLREVSALLEAGKAMNSVLELDSVLDIILGGALELLLGTSGSIMLVDAPKQLTAACVRGNERARDRAVPFGEGIAGRVALDREPLLIHGRADAEQFPGLVDRTEPVESAMCVPLVHREELLGVLNINTDAGHRFTEYDLRALSLFAEQAAGAIANARLYEAEQARVAELTELDRLKSEFVALVSHELRTPLTSILSASGTLQRPDLAETRDEVAGIIERQARRLAQMLENLLDTVRSEQPGVLPKPSPVDVAELVREAAGDFELVGSPVEVEAPATLLVRGDAYTLRRVLDNLLDNAHKYGRPPVRAVVRTDGSTAIVSVIDRGAGIPSEERELVFERFSRLERAEGRPGLGLGLPIVRGLVTACGGSVWIEDAPAGGTAVCISLALCPDEEKV